MLRVLACVALFGCGASKVCRVEAEALGKLLEEVSVELPAPIMVDEDIALVERADLAQRELHSAPVVGVTPAGFRYRGEPVSADQLRVKLDEFSRGLRDDLQSGRLPRDWAPEPRLVYFAIASDTPMPRVRDAIGIARDADLITHAFVFVAPVTVKPPPRSAVDNKLDEIQRSLDPSSRATALAELLERQVRQCPEVKDVFGVLANSNPGNRALALARGIAPALIACRCDVNMPELRSSLFRLVFIARPLRVVQLDPDQPAEIIELAADATWLEASKRVSSTTRNLELVVR